MVKPSSTHLKYKSSQRKSVPRMNIHCQNMNTLNDERTDEQQQLNKQQNYKIR